MISNRRQKRSSIWDVIIPLAGLVPCTPFLFACLNPNQEHGGLGGGGWGIGGGGGCGNAAVITANTRHIVSWRCCRQLRHSINVFFHSHAIGPTRYCWTQSIFFITATLFCLSTTCKLIDIYSIRKFPWRWCFWAVSGACPCGRLTGHVMTDSNIGHFKSRVQLRCVSV